jgi:cation-transporting ATPase E
MNAVESASHIDVLCLDKAGTLTTNDLTLHTLAPLGSDEATVRAHLGDYAASTSAGNHTMAAILAACDGQPRRVREEVPFSSARKWSALALDSNGVRGVYVLGAPEVLAPVVPAAPLDRQAAGWTARGLRVLLFAFRSDDVPLYGAGGERRLPDSLTLLALTPSPTSCGLRRARPSPGSLTPASR